MDRHPAAGSFFARIDGTPCASPAAGHSYPKETSTMAMISLKVNGEALTREVAPQTLLVEFLREGLRLTGTHVGCDSAQCGACTVHVNGRAVKSCSMLAVQAQGAEVLTIEGVTPRDGSLHPMQEAFRQCHGLQCGFCTPGMVMSALDLVRQCPQPSEQQVREQLDGNLCRCTGYHNIVKAVQQGASSMASTK
jgi:aerobic carbon-monoxide dehydrogenase small subunit